MNIGSRHTYKSNNNLIKIQLIHFQSSKTSTTAILRSEPYNKVLSNVLTEALDRVASLIIDAREITCRAADSC